MRATFLVLLCVVANAWLGTQERVQCDENQQSTAPAAATELDAKVVEAWQTAGVRAGWYGQNEGYGQAPGGHWQFTEAKPRDRRPCQRLAGSTRLLAGRFALIPK